MKTYIALLLGLVLSANAAEIPNIKRTPLTTNYPAANVEFTGTTVFSNSGPNVIFELSSGSMIVSNAQTGASFEVTSNGVVNNFNYMVNVPYNEYNLKYFGARIDGKMGTNVAAVGGTTTLTIGSGNLTSADVGKPILIWNAGTSYTFVNGNGVSGTYTNTHRSTIVSVSTPTTCVIAEPVSTTAINSSAIWGTDDTAAWNSAIAYVTTNGGGTIVVPAGISCVAAQVQDPIANDIDTNIHKNAQIIFPDVPVSGQVCTTIRIRGAGMQGPQQAIGPFLRQNSWGTLVVPMLVTNQRVSFMNTENLTTWQFWNNAVAQVVGKFGRRWTFYNPIRVEISDISFRFPANPNYFGLDLRGCDSASVENVFIDVGNAIGYTPYPQYTNSSVALMMPEALSAGVSGVNNYTVYGFRSGMSVGEHLIVGNYIAIDCWDAVSLQTGGHITKFSILDAEACHNTINVIPIAGTGYAFSLTALITGELDSTTHWASPRTLVNDPYNAVYGTVVYEDTQGGITNNGGAGIQFLKLAGTSGALHESVETFTNNVVMRQTLTAGNILATNYNGGAGSVKVALPDEAQDARYAIATGPSSGAWYINKIRQAGIIGPGGYYDNILAFILFDTIGTRYVAAFDTNSYVKATGGFAGMEDGDPTTISPAKFPVGIIMGAGKDYMDSASNSVVGIADNSNVKLNPPADGGSVYLNYDRGQGVFFGDGNATAVVASVDTAGKGTFPTIVVTNLTVEGSPKMAGSLLWTNNLFIVRNNDAANVVLNAVADAGYVYLATDKGVGVRFGNSAASVTYGGSATFTNVLTTNLTVQGVTFIADNLSFTNGNTLLGLADKANVKINPPAANGAIYINYDRGTGVYFGNGAASGLWGSIKAGGYQQATNAISSWPTAATTGGDFAIVNSNATVYILTSTPNSTAWAATNKLAGP